MQASLVEFVVGPVQGVQGPIMVADIWGAVGPVATTLVEDDNAALWLTELLPEAFFAEVTEPSLVLTLWESTPLDGGWSHRFVKVLPADALAKLAEAA